MKFDIKVLFKIFPKEVIIDNFKDKVFLSALGARTCYNKEDVCYLLEEDHRVISGEDRKKFLERLGYEYYHTSIFAHTFAYFNVKSLTYKLLSEYFDNIGESLWLKYGSYYDVLEKDNYALNKIIAAILSANLFKSVWVKDTNIIGLSLRHFIEASKDCEECRKIILELFEKSTFEEPELMNKYYNDFKNRKRKVLPLYIEKSDNTPGWAVFAIQDVSRTMTHQLVRHTKLNFSQRSQRYIDEYKANDTYNKLFITPPTVSEKETVRNKFENLKYQSFEFYKFARENNIPKEDARFGFLEASKTSIVVSGTYDDIVDFVEKRKIKQAQWEIRSVALEIDEILKSSM